MTEKLFVVVSTVDAEGRAVPKKDDLMERVSDAVAAVAGGLRKAGRNGIVMPPATFRLAADAESYASACAYSLKSPLAVVAVNVDVELDHCYLVEAKTQFLVSAGSGKVDLK